MAFLQGFEHDVFISYCHDDNEVAGGGKGWVDLFSEELRIALKQESGQRERIDIWRDPELRRAQLLDEAIRRAICGSGVMLVLLSKAYQGSDYCEQERHWFREEASQRQTGLEVGDYPRIVPVLLRDIPPEERPADCRGPLGFVFHHTEGDEIGWPLDPDSKAFRTELRRLVGDLWTILRELQGQQPAPSEDTAEAAAEDTSPFRVFLSQTPVDLRPIREQLRTTLAEKGVEILPELPPPYPQAEHSAGVKEALQQADLSIHLLGLDPGKAIEDSKDKTYPVEQALLGLEHSRSQLFLMREEFDAGFIEDSAYGEFVRSLSELKRDADKCQVIRTGRHQMIDEILAARRRLIKAARSARASEKVTAFVDLHPKDWSRAGALIDYLEEKKISWQVASSNDRSRFEEALKATTLFLVVFGEVARDWVLGRLDKALKLSLEKSLRVRRAVLLTSAMARGQVDFGGEVEIVDSVDRFDPSRLEALLV